MWQVEGIGGTAVRAVDGRLCDRVHEDLRGRCGEHLGYLPPQELGGWKVQQVIGGRVVFLDEAVPIDPEHEIGQGAQHRLQPLLGAAQFRLHPDALRDVLDDGQIATPLLAVALERGAGQADPDHRAVRTKVAFVQVITGNLPGVQACHLVAVGLQVVRVGEMPPVTRQQLRGWAIDDGGEPSVDLDDPSVAQVGQCHPQRQLLEHGIEARLGRLLGLPGGQRPAAPVLVPQPPTGTIGHQQGQPHDQGRDTGGGTHTGEGLVLVDLGHHHPGRVGDGGGVGQHGYAAIIHPPLDDAVPSLCRHLYRQRGGQSGRLHGLV